MYFRFLITLILFQIFGIVPAYACVSNGYSHYETSRFNSSNNSQTSAKNISSPVLRGALSTGVSGGLVGGLTGGVGAALSGGDFFTGMGQGAIYGIGTGLTTGVYGGYQGATAMDRDPWTGKANKAIPTLSTKGYVVIGETMERVSLEAEKIPNSITLNDMPDYTGTKSQITSKMMEYNRKWILKQMRNERMIIDIGIDMNRANPSIFYQMEQSMIENYMILHPEWSNYKKQ